MLRAHTFKDVAQVIEEEDRQVWYNKWKIEVLDSYKQAFNQEDREKVVNNLLEQVEKHEQRILDLKDKFHSNLNMWTFDYPILMAADIIGYDVDVVPVGKDQLQHLEMARDMARYVNHHYGEEILREPKAIIDEDIAVIPGLDGRKMSKSYNNYISMLESSADLKKKNCWYPNRW